MILVIDVGNTNITYGVYENGKLKCSFHTTTKAQHTSDEYGVQMLEMLRFYGVAAGDIEGVIISSVVSDIMHSLNGSVVRYVGCTPMVVGPGIKTGIRVVTENPRGIGADRIVDAAGAYGKYGGPVLVLDFGTATTYDLIGPGGTFQAGVTAPGIRICAEALSDQTAMLPRVELKKPASILAQETISSMQAGIIYGQIGQTEYIINKIKEESGYTDLKVVATGGLGRIIAEETDSIDIYDSSLTLDGLYMIYEKNKKQSSVQADSKEIRESGSCAG